jgi:hypothetical protein
MIIQLVLLAQGFNGGNAEPVQLNTYLERKYSCKYSQQILPRTLDRNFVKDQGFFNLLINQLIN